MARLIGTILGLLMVGGILLSGCAPSEERPSNVLLISIDTLRADRLGCYGFGRPTSPVLDALAASGTLFEYTVAQSPWTLPSHAALMTGQYHHRIGVVDEWKRLPEEVPTLATLLKEQGLFTGALVNSLWVTEEFGFRKGFETSQFFIETQGNKGREITDEAITWLGEHGDRPFFLFVHYYDVHSSYTPEPAFRDLFVDDYQGKAQGITEELQAARDGKIEFTEACVNHVSNLYDAEIRQLDAQIKRLLDRLRDRGLKERTLVVVTADHGEEFMEHGGLLHGRTLYEEVLRVPLIMSGPGIPVNLRVKELAMLTDVVPTVLGCLGISWAGPMDGLDLIHRIQAPDPARLERLAFASADHHNEKPDILRMVQSRRYKLCYNRLTKGSELFDLEKDAAERINIVEDRPGVAKRFMEYLERIMALEGKATPAGPRSKEDEERLRALGY